MRRVESGELRVKMWSVRKADTVFIRCDDFYCNYPFGCCNHKKEGSRPLPTLRIRDFRAAAKLPGTVKTVPYK